jgi:hypothetical protein
MSRCDVSTSAPDFCADFSVYDNVKAAYNTLWDVIDANSDELSTEMWSWVYENGNYEIMPLAVMPTPPDDGTQTGTFFVSSPCVPILSPFSAFSYQSVKNI